MRQGPLIPFMALQPFPAALMCAALAHDCICSYQVLPLPTISGSASSQILGSGKCMQVCTLREKNLNSLGALLQNAKIRLQEIIQTMVTFVFARRNGCCLFAPASVQGREKTRQIVSKKNCSESPFNGLEYSEASWQWSEIEERTVYKQP